MYNSVYLLISNFKFIPSWLSPLVTVSFFFLSQVKVFLCFRIFAELKTEASNVRFWSLILVQLIKEIRCAPGVRDERNTLWKEKFVWGRQGNRY